MQVVERHLVDGLEDIFDMTRLQSLNDEEVAKITAEDEGTKVKRANLDQKVADLKKAYGECLAIETRISQKMVIVHQLPSKVFD